MKPVSGDMKVEVSVYMDGGIVLGKYACRTLDQLNEVLEKARKHDQVKVVQAITIEGGVKSSAFSTEAVITPFKLTKFTYIVEKGEWVLVANDNEFCPEGARKLYR